MNHLSTPLQHSRASKAAMPLSEPAHPELQVTSNAIRALAHPARLSILCLLLEREHSVVDLTRRIGNHTQSSISQRLGFLLKNNIVINRKHQTRMLYRIRDGRVQELMQLVAQMYCRRGGGCVSVLAAS